MILALILGESSFGGAIPIRTQGHRTEAKFPPGSRIRQQNLTEVLTYTYIINAQSPVATHSRQVWILATFQFRSKYKADPPALIISEFPQHSESYPEGRGYSTDHKADPPALIICELRISTTLRKLPRGARLFDGPVERRSGLRCSKLYALMNQCGISRGFLSRCRAN